MRSLKYPSPLVGLENFSNRLVWDDTLHVAFRGFAPDYIASSLVDLFGKGQALNKAFEAALSWAHWHGHPLSCDEFSLSDDKFPSLNAKAWDCKVLSLWLVT